MSSCRIVTPSFWTAPQASAHANAVPNDDDDSSRHDQHSARPVTASCDDRRPLSTAVESVQETLSVKSEALYSRGLARFIATSELTWSWTMSRPSRSRGERSRQVSFVSVWRLPPAERRARRLSFPNRRNHESWRQHRAASLAFLRRRCARTSLADGPAASVRSPTGD
jgi:hypothetical protein